MVNKEQQILELIKYGETHVPTIYRRVDCSSSYVYKIAKKNGFIVTSKEEKLVFSQLTIDQIFDQHKKIIDRTGGEHGILNLGTLEFTLKEAEKYSDISKKVAIIIQGISEWHPFMDGNKRTALALAEACLIQHGLQLSIHTEEIVRFLLEVADYKYENNLEGIVKWVEKYISIYEEKKEETQQRINTLTTSVNEFQSIGKKIKKFQLEIEKGTPNMKLNQKIDEYFGKFKLDSIDVFEVCQHDYKSDCEYYDDYYGGCLHCSLSLKIHVMGQVYRELVQEVMKEIDWLRFHTS